MCRPQLSLTQAERSQVDPDVTGKSSNTSASQSSRNRAQLPKQQCGLTWTIQFFGGFPLFCCSWLRNKESTVGSPCRPIFVCLVFVLAARKSYVRVVNTFCV